jgi:hypothetical protein
LLHTGGRAIDARDEPPIWQRPCDKLCCQDDIFSTVDSILCMIHSNEYNYILHTTAVLFGQFRRSRHLVLGTGVKFLLDREINAFCEFPAENDNERQVLAANAKAFYLQDQC